VLNKDVLSQAEALVCLRMIGTRDVGAIDDWVRVHAEEEEARTVKASLPSLPVGTAWLWSPGWLGVLEKIAIPAPVTFDSSATPKPGQARQRVKRMAQVDLDALGEKIEATVQRQAENDPASLRRRIKELERELAQTRKAKPVPERVEVPVISDDTAAALERIGEVARQAAEEYGEKMQLAAQQMMEAMKAVRVVQPDWEKVTQAVRPSEPVQQQARVARTVASSNGNLPRAQRRILAALATHGPRSVQQVGVLTGYSHKGGGFSNALSALRSSGYMEGSGAELRITETGVHALGNVEGLPTGDALREFWKQHQAIGLAAGRILDVLAQAWPEEVPIPEIAERTGYAANGGGFNNAVSRLRALELAHGRRALRISDDLVGA
jgi:hypothetical protein